ncbi:MAG: hypothetical protein ACREKL_04175 [Chthoniobacterales bacterium]
MNPGSRLWLIVAGFFAFALAALFGVAMSVPLNHDEHQFVASAALLANQGLLPYRDFPYFHTPNLVGLYALIFKGTDHLLLATRACSTICAWLAGIVLFAFAWRRFADRAPRARMLFALGIATLFFANPVFVYTFPKAWNNVVPVLFTLLAFVCHSRGAATSRAKWFFAGGALIALAAGARISFAPLGLPFLVAAWFAPGARWRAIGACVLGMLLGSIPVLLVFASAPADFLFDNLVYNSRVNSAYRIASGDDRSAFLSKGVFVLKVLVNPGNAVLFAAFIYAAWRAVRAKLWRHDFPLTFVLPLFPFALIGVFAPTPSYSQYYLILTALCCLGVTCGFSRLPAAARFFARPACVLCFAVAVSVIASVYEYRGAAGLFAPGNWTPIRLHAEGLALREHVPNGRILTVAPIIPLEGGFEIYPAFATGSFAWRTAPFLSKEDREKYGFVTADGLAALLAASPPAGILLGYDKKREEDLLDFVEKNHFQRIKLPDKKNLWLPPAATIAR